MTPSRHLLRPTPLRGFTLLELMVGAVTTTIILAAVAASFVAVQGSYQAESQIKRVVEGLRGGTTFIEQRLKLAGYGVDPRHAFDFQVGLLPGSTKANHVLAFGQAPMAITDDLAFRYRDPAWMRRGRLDGTSIRLESGSFGTTFPAGKRFMVSCIGGRDYVVLKAGGTGVSKELNAASGFSVDSALSSVQADAPCLARTGELAPFILLIHEVRVRIMPLGGRPFLMAFPSIDELDLSQAVPLAADVESFQVAYVMNRPPEGSAHATLPAVDSSSSPSNWVMGDVGSADADRHPDPEATPAPRYETSYTDSARYGRHPANIRAVRVTIGVRSARREPNGRQAFARLGLEDSGEEIPEADGYYRSNLTTTVRIPNMLSRSAFNPPVGGITSGLNVWGG